MPVAQGRLDRHTLSLLRHRLGHRGRGREEDPGLRLALGRCTRRLSPTPLFVGAVLGLCLGSLDPLTHRPSVLFVFGRSRDGSMHHDPARNQRLVKPSAA
jgi:hypothetical protein